jgi:hypothetical protein
MSSPSTNLIVNFGRQWSIRRPPVYRYLNAEHVTEFFDHGLLRLSSFQAFAKHTDEQRADNKEGDGVLVHQNTDKDNPFTIFSRIAQGQNAYVLCGSTIYSDELKGKFKATSGFRINDTTSFADAVANSLPGFAGGVEGACWYMDHRAIGRSFKNVDLDSLRMDDGSENLDFQKIANLSTELAGVDLFFIKETRYSPQCEYRLLWMMNQEREMQDFIVVECPEAVRFCTRFDDLWTERRTKEAEQAGA